MMTEIRDILLFVVSYPNRTPHSALEAALQLANQFDSRLSVLVCQSYIPAVSNWLADKLVHANEVIASENARSREATSDLLLEFSNFFGEGRRGEALLVKCGPMVSSMEAIGHARTHDLTVVPIAADVEFQTAAEAFIFESGRPVLLLPNSAPELLDVVIGWDGSRAAARCLAASLPFCHKARSIRLVAVAGDKPFDHLRGLQEAQRHLLCHDIASLVEVVHIKDRDVGGTLMAHAVETGANLLVMGAYGHSKAREFILGGATRTVLDDPQLPVLLAH